MAETGRLKRKATLDKDLDKLTDVGEAAALLARGLVAPGLALLFLALAAVFASIHVFGEPRAVIVVATAAIGAYMALNIGANDVANNVGPAVGAKVITMGGALALAAVFESAGALIAGSDVAYTIAENIIDRVPIADPGVFIRVMLAALVSSALWINFATWIGAPVSTTYSIVGSVVGAGIAAAGLSAVNWSVMAGITAGWIVSPVLGGLIAVGFLSLIKARIVYRDDKIAAARRWVPFLIAVMAGSFTAYLATKGLNRVVSLGAFEIALLGLAAFALAWRLAHVFVRRRSEGMENRNQSLRRLFNYPLIFSAALLSFAHGANDVANAVGPVAAIVHAASGNDVAALVRIPAWVMVIGALGISVGLLLFGPRLVRMVGKQITRLNPMRAFCVALSSAITVLVASWLGLPVSSTHVAVGAVFGVGFFREWYAARSRRRRAYVARRGELHPASPVELTTPVRRSRKKVPSRTELARRRLVRRAHVIRIVAAWVITAPVTALLAAGVFRLLDLLA